MRKEVKLGDILDYEQPNSYIVRNSNYDKKFATPVLTAGQSFILGYTNEKENIFKAKENPVIIFDDFTTASKYVDFDFKVKSSAMKILKPKEGINIKYVYYAMQNIKFDNQLHKRYWISEYSKIKLLIPDIKIQEKIVKELDLINKLINYKRKQEELLDDFIKSQFVEMFGEPLISNNYGRITLDKLIKVSQGLQIPIEKRKNDKGRNRYKYITIQYLNGSKKEEYIENPNERVICNKEDILMTRTGNTGQVITNVEGVFHNNFFKMDYDRKIINKEFLIKYFENELIYKDIIRRATTSTIPDLSHSQFYKMSIDLPPLELQNQFSEIVKQIDKQKFEIEKSLKETQELYESLMDEYFEGEKR